MINRLINLSSNIYLEIYVFYKQAVIDRLFICTLCYLMFCICDGSRVNNLSERLHRIDLEQCATELSLIFSKSEMQSVPRIRLIVIIFNFNGLQQINRYIDIKQTDRSFRVRVRVKEMKRAQHARTHTRKLKQIVLLMVSKVFGSVSGQ